MYFHLTEPRLPPRNIVANAINATSVAITWKPPLIEGQNGPIQGYNIGVIGIDTDEDFMISSNSTNVIIKKLHPFFLYNFSVAAITISQGPSSESITVKMPTSGEYHNTFIFHHSSAP